MEANVTSEITKINESGSRKAKYWNTTEDNALRAAVEKYGCKNWKLVAADVSSRNPVQCLHRWSKILHPGHKRGSWSKEEDEKLINWVMTYGNKKWAKASKEIEGRSGK